MASLDCCYWTENRLLASIEQSKRGVEATDPCLSLALSALNSPFVSVHQLVVRSNVWSHFLTGGAFPRERTQPFNVTVDLMRFLSFSSGILEFGRWESTCIRSRTACPAVADDKFPLSPP